MSSRHASGAADDDDRNRRWADVVYLAAKKPPAENLHCSTSCGIGRDGPWQMRDLARLLGDDEHLCLFRRGLTGER